MDQSSGNLMAHGRHFGGWGGQMDLSLSDGLGGFSLLVFVVTIIFAIFVRISSDFV